MLRWNIRRCSKLRGFMLNMNNELNEVKNLRASSSTGCLLHDVSWHELTDWDVSDDLRVTSLPVFTPRRYEPLRAQPSAWVWSDSPALHLPDEWFSADVEHRPNTVSSGLLQLVSRNWTDNQCSRGNESPLWENVKTRSSASHCFKSITHIVPCVKNQYDLI